MDDCEDCGRSLCRDCDTHYCIEQCPCGRSHTCDCACAEYLEGLSSAVDATAAVTSPSEKEAAATLARDCTDHAAVLLWCADRVRSVDDSETVQDAADYLHDLSTRAQVDTTTVTDQAAVIRWCAEQIHSMGGDADVERAAEYLDDLAVEAQEAADGERAMRVPGTWNLEPGQIPPPQQIDAAPDHVTEK